MKQQGDLISISVRELNEEVLIARDPIVQVSREDIEFLKARARLNRRKRIRLCAHKSIEDKVHEMLIVHGKNAYVRPHKHLTKSESFHVIEGSVWVVMFSDGGEIDEVVKMGDFASGHKFYYRIDAGVFHTLLITSEWLVFHETGAGPFNKADTGFPDWAPADEDVRAIHEYLSELRQKVMRFTE